jgi:hypothetical protein
MIHMNIKNFSHDFLFCETVTELYAKIAGTSWKLLLMLITEPDTVFIANLHLTCYFNC